MILHADLDAFYASVAQRDDPSLRGKPVAVSGSSRRAVVLTASYEARPFGVRSALPLYMALERCPQLIVVPPDFQKYRTASRAVFAVFARHAAAVQAMSLDEAFLDLGDIPVARAHAIAMQIKADVRAQTALTISIGIAAVKMVAKIASDEGKPDGLVLVEPGTERAYLADKPVGMIWGIGPKTQARLAERGITSIRQIAALSDERCAELFGKWGTGVRDLARGIDGRKVVEGRESRSISSEETLERDAADVRAVVELVREQGRHVAQRLRREELRAYTIGVKIKHADFTVTGRQTRMVQPTDDPRVIAAAAAFCLRRAWSPGTAVRLVGVRASTLVHRAARQMALFG